MRHGVGDERRDDVLRDRDKRLRINAEQNEVDSGDGQRCAKREWKRERLIAVDRRQLLLSNTLQE